MFGNDGLVISVTMIEGKGTSENGKLNMNNNPMLNPAFETSVPYIR